jgi:predicted 3-demethylubiquinone-9 3-methyltransferase (glyoxalase superfamily)
MQKIVPCLWYDDDAEEAARRYASLIPGSSVGAIARYGAAGHDVHGRPEGSVLTVDVDLGGTRICALNGGPHFRFTPAISLFVTLEDEAAVDRLWEGLLEGGTVMMPLQAYDWSAKYGWLADRWGLTWQIALGRTAEVGRTMVPAFLFTGEQFGRAEEAIGFYTSLFDGSTVDGVLKNEGAGPGGTDTVRHAQFRLSGETFMVMESDHNHGFGFNEAVSLMIYCKDQAEIDRFWSAMSAVPEAEQCGWLKDPFGVSWQVVPEAMDAMMLNPDRARVDRVMTAFLAMKKFDLAALQRAYAA